jgi:glycogen debranching enzyme
VWSPIAIFDADAEPPYTPRGCCAQAWSVAEVIRVAMVIESTRGDQKSDTNR